LDTTTMLDTTELDKAEVADIAAVVNGPEDELLDWDAVGWRHAEQNVRRLRQRIFAASRAAGCSRAFRACLSRLPGKRAWPVLTRIRE
jgi:hypothetical protein